MLPRVGIYRYSSTRPQFVASYVNIDTLLRGDKLSPRMYMTICRYLGRDVRINITAPIYT